MLVRVDYNVPFEPGTQNISDDSRIAASVETIQLPQGHRGCKRDSLFPPWTPTRADENEDLSLAPISSLDSLRFSGEEITFVERLHWPWSLHQAFSRCRTDAQ